jgi:hypothetical protein
MTLHRDIFWLGRQWAVTGYGIQAVNKKLEGKFDVDVSRLWEDGLTEPMLSEPWFDLDDFKEALYQRPRILTHFGIPKSGKL